MARIFLAVLFLIGFLRLPIEAQAPAPATAYDHILFVLLENVGYEAVIGHAADAPYINNTLLPQGVLYTQSFGIMHPSLPNYLAIFSGSTQGVIDDKCTNGPFNVVNLYREMNAAGLTCMEYAENLPAIGSQTCSQNHYAKRHNPFPWFTGVPGSSWVPYVGPYPSGGPWPNFTFVTPNVYDDMHTCLPNTTCTTAQKVRQGDAWLSRNLPPLISYAQAHNGLVVLTMDEGHVANHIPTILIGPRLLPGTQNSRQVDHYDTLKTVTDNFGLAPMANCVGRRGLF